jgi:2-oxoisovalerate dehydrogenase E1 component beta subunit
VTGFDTPFPYALEKLYIPDARRLLDTIRSTMHF